MHLLQLQGSQKGSDSNGEEGEYGMKRSIIITVVFFMISMCFVARHEELGCPVYIIYDPQYCGGIVIQCREEEFYEMCQKLSEKFSEFDSVRLEQEW